MDFFIKHFMIISLFFLLILFLVYAKISKNNDSKQTVKRDGFGGMYARIVIIVLYAGYHIFLTKYTENNDNIRLQDMNTIKNELEVYHKENGNYPTKLKTKTILGQKNDLAGDCKVNYEYEVFDIKKEEKIINNGGYVLRTCLKQLEACNLDAECGTYGGELMTNDGGNSSIRYEIFENLEFRKR